MKKYFAEFLGTFVLVLFGTGVAVVTEGNLVATALAFGLAIIADAYVIGNISGCHVNPAVSFAMLVSKKMNIKDFCYYVLSQVLGAIIASAILILILNNTDLGTANLGANYYGELSAFNISATAALATEIILTFVFIYTILGVTSDKKYENISGLVIGLTLTFVHLLGIKLTGTSVNPARSIGPAIYLGEEAIKELWVFIIGPFVGALLAACTYQVLNTEEKRIIRRPRKKQVSKSN